MSLEKIQIENHAEGYEKHGQKDIAEGADITDDLVREIRVGESQPGQKRADGERQSQRFRDPGDAHGDDHGHDHQHVTHVHADQALQRKRDHAPRRDQEGRR